ncbi:hypothetical protein [Jiangella anatolica]|uniref:Uncharacterized protein n=1 Tax=Jiangella anatolica TaxID=2670374 RepID=A0A2W2B5L4_9ACTN|nr:hypothetical protein [Jiangella anatolica]PZF80330.1 hypothetical protein C1I92_26645 [Jiangella anatolica]
MTMTVAFLLLGVAGLGACSDDGDAPEVATAQTETDAPSVALTAGPDDEPSTEPGPLAFTQCMRDNGIDMADPDPTTGRPQVGEGVDPDSPAYQDAMEACADLLGEGAALSEPDPAELDQYQAFAECMRDNGLPEFPDPQPGGQGLFDGIDRTNPGFQAALEACQDVLPAGGDQ